MVDIFSHHDYDGIASAYFLSIHLGDKFDNVYFPEDFGDTTGMKEGDWMTDMKPKPKIKNIKVIDHHPPYDHGQNAPYDLTWRPYPAGLITWKLFKDEIPKNEWWKAAGACMGDAQPEEIPYEIWKECPQLLKKYNTSAYHGQGKNYNKWKYPSFRLYKLTSSPINALRRVGEVKEAFELLRAIDDPVQLYNHKLVKEAKGTVRSSFRYAMKNAKMTTDLNFKLIIFSSDISLCGYIATTQMDNSDYYTVLAVNKKNGHLSMRGEMCNFYMRLLEDNLDYISGSGHGCFDKETEVLTTNGWKLFENIDLDNDKFYSLNPKTHEIEIVNAVNYIKYNYKGNMLHFTNGTGSTDLMVTPNHKIPVISDWRWRHSDNKEIRFKRADSIAKHDRIPTGLGTWSRYNAWDIRENTRQVSILGFGNLDLVDYDDFVYDVELEKNHILLVRRNGKYIWSGNSAMGGRIDTSKVDRFRDDVREIITEYSDKHNLWKTIQRQ